jgi:hypothetical protein
MHATFAHAQGLGEGAEGLGTALLEGLHDFLTAFSYSV